MANGSRTEPHVVIAGGGFGGLAAARALSRAKVRVTLVDQRNFHLFQPLLYQVATGALSPADIASPIRRLARGSRRLRVLWDRVARVDTSRKALVTDHGEVPYDRLILATGARHAYFGHEGWEALAPGLKSLEDALEIRRRVLTAFEEAERSPDAAQRSALLTFVVVGGGPTGVELAGALAEIARRTVAKDFRIADPAAARVVLVEAADRILPGYADRLSRYAVRALERLGAEVRVSTAVAAVTPDGVVLDGGLLRAGTVLWAAGVAASPVGATLGMAVDRHGRVPVGPDLTVSGHPDVFVIGDLAACKATGGHGTLPGLATVALQQGRHAAANVLRQLRGAPTLPFRYHDKGSLATIGRRLAVGDVRGRTFTGTLAWLVWLAVHIAYLAGFENRVLVLVQWAWAYFTFDRGARLITGAWRPGGSDGPRS